MLRVDGARNPSNRGPVLITNTWYADVIFAHGIVRELHRVDVAHYDRGALLPAVDDRTDLHVRLVTHTTP